MRAHTIATLKTILTIGTRPREFNLAEAEPLTAPLPLEWLEQALQRRSKSDFSNNTVLFEADSAAIFSSAFDRISRAMSMAWGESDSRDRGLRSWSLSERNQRGKEDAER